MLLALISSFSILLVILFLYQRYKFQQVQNDLLVIKAIHLETCWASWRLLEDIYLHHEDLTNNELVLLLSDITGYSEYVSDENHEDQVT